MGYVVKEIYYTLQCEGANVGRPAVFCRFTGCNLWSGRENDRPGAICRFCDTDFVGTDGPGGGRYGSADELADAVARTWPFEQNGNRPLVVCTGGEPALQMDEALVDALHQRGFHVAIETNGTRPLPRGIDWVCVSPKAGSELIVTSGAELKFVYPQDEISPDEFEHLEFENLFLQPMDGPEIERNRDLALTYCLNHPKWRYSVQVQKVLGIP